MTQHVQPVHRGRGMRRREASVAILELAEQLTGAWVEDVEVPPMLVVDATCHGRVAQLASEESWMVPSVDFLTFLQSHQDFVMEQHHELVAGHR